MKDDPTLYEPKCMFCQISSIIGAVGSVVGGIFGSNAAEDASDAQVRAAQIAADLGREGLGFQKDVFNIGRADTDPYRASGAAALGTLNDLFIPGGQAVVQMQSRLNELRARRSTLDPTAGGATSAVQAAGSGSSIPATNQFPNTPEGNILRARAEGTTRIGGVTPERFFNFVDAGGAR